MRSLLLGFCVLVSSSALAQAAISGTVSATFLGYESGQPRMQVDVNLACSLTCDTSAPTKHFAIVAGASSYFASEPATRSGFSNFFTTDLDPDGQASTVSTNFKPGSVNFVKATSVTCHCGNRNGEGGFIDLTSANVVVPPLIGNFLTQRVGRTLQVTINAALKGGEQASVTVSGAGITASQTVGAGDLDSSGYFSFDTTPTTTGTVTITATMLPSGPSHTATVEVLPANTGTGGGGGSSATGGGAGGGGGSEPAGCAAGGGALAVALALLLARRRA